eukprot:Pgem_evm1s4408
MLAANNSEKTFTFKSSSGKNAKSVEDWKKILAIAAKENRVKLKRKVGISEVWEVFYQMDVTKTPVTTE